MVQTAFQPNAFQHNAFQIFSIGGLGTHYLPRKKRKKIRKLKAQYQEVISAAAETKEIISAVDPYIEPQNEAEWDRRYKAQYVVVDQAPSIQRIDFISLYENELALLRFQQALAKIKARIKELTRLRNRQDEEVLIMMMLMEV